MLRHLRRRCTNVSLLASLVAKRPGWRRHTAFAVVALALTAVIVLLGTPSALARVPRERATVMMALDASLSKQVTDISPNQFQVMRAAATHFVDLVPSGINLAWCRFPARPPRW